MIKKIFKKFINMLGYELKKKSSIKTKNVHEQYPAGHYYSMIPSYTKDLTDNPQKILSKFQNLDGINIKYDYQLKLLRTLIDLSNTPPFFSKEKKRYDFENNYFSYDDAPILSLMIRKLRPKNIIEIGSGFSTACILDTIDIFFEEDINLTSIDISFDRLKKLLHKEDYKRIKLSERAIQDVNSDIFFELGENDLLFIDSSHVFKYGSDLEKIFFEILPKLQKGVMIHFHDIFYPFAYHQDWFERGAYLNEAYFLRSFLMYNNDFQIELWLNYIINNIQNNEDLLSSIPIDFDAWSNRFSNGSDDYHLAFGSIYLRKI